VYDSTIMIAVGDGETRRQSMHQWKASNLNQVYLDIYNTICQEGTVVSPKGKATKELHPAVIQITNPRQRYCSSRAGFNLPFSCAEVLWILAGRGDAEMICHYLPRFDEFRDKPWKQFHAPYGTRLRNYGYDERDEYHHPPPVDQLEQAYRKLKADPDTRQAVMVLWDVWRDNLQVSVDYPCNNWSHLMIRNGKLDWTQVVRSNDAILGMPQNIFQFTHLQEVMAGWLGVDVGTYTHFADSLHLYTDSFYSLDKMKPTKYDIYEEYYDEWDARMKKPDFDELLVQMSDAEECWRNGELGKQFHCSNQYWTSFMSVIRAYNLSKLGRHLEAYDEVVEHVSNEYFSPMLKYLEKKIEVV
jgi:thymidylate synthase